MENIDFNSNTRLTKEISYNILQKEINELEIILEMKMSSKVRNKLSKKLLVYVIYEVQERKKGLHVDSIRVQDNAFYIMNKEMIFLIENFKKLVNMCFMILDLDLKDREIYYYFNNLLTWEQRERLSDNVSSMAYLFRSRGKEWSANFFFFYDKAFNFEQKTKRNFERILFLILKLRNDDWCEVESKENNIWFKRNYFKFIKKNMYKYEEVTREITYNMNKQVFNILLKNKKEVNEVLNLKKEVSIIQQSGFFLITDIFIYYLTMVDINIYIHSINGENENEEVRITKEDEKKLEDWLCLVKIINSNFRKILILLLRRRLMSFQGELYKNFDAYLKSCVSPIIKKEKLTLGGKFFKPKKVIIYDL